MITRPTHANSLDDLSAILGTTERQWRTYSKRPGFPAKEAGKGYDVAACEAWKSEHVKPQASGELATEKIRKTKADADLAELRVAKEKRLSVSRAEVNELLGKMAMKLKSYLYSKLTNEMPAKMAGLDALAHAIYGEELADEIVTRLREDVDQWDRA